jgi:hypothetical protein
VENSCLREVPADRNSAHPTVYKLAARFVREQDILARWKSKRGSDIVPAVYSVRFIVSYSILRHLSALTENNLISNSLNKRNGKRKSLFDL